MESSISAKLLSSTRTPIPTDCNFNGIEDYCEPDFEDLNNNGLADICEDIDCDDDGIPDPIEIEKGTPDTNQNGIPDEWSQIATAMAFWTKSKFKKAQPSISTAMELTTNAILIATRTAYLTFFKLSRARLTAISMGSSTVVK